MSVVTDIFQQKVSVATDIFQQKCRSQPTFFVYYAQFSINLLYMLDKASLIKMIFEESKTIKKLQKPDKLYIENTNTLHAISSHSVDIGTVRETFCVNQLSHNHEVEYSKQKGDFLIDRKYTVEVGGRNKGFTQISGVENSFILADDIESPFGRKLPLWTMGFLY